MEILATVVMIAGALVSIIGGIWFLVVAFQESVLWGLGCIFVPFVSLIFLIMNFGESWKPFVMSMAGSAVVVIGVLLLASGQTP